MFKIGDRVKCINNKGWGDKLKTDVIYTVINVDITDEIRIRDFYKTYSYWIRGSRFEKVEDNMEKSFKEVVRDIKYDEVWESDNFTIELDEKDIVIRHKDGFNIDCIGYTFSENEKFKLQREQYTFTEAFKAYEEGKEIESCENGYKILQNTFKYPNDISGNWVCLRDSDQIFTIATIRGKWFINN